MTCISEHPANDFKVSIFQLEKVVGLTGFVIIHVFIASFCPAQRERNQMGNTKFTRPVNEMRMSTSNQTATDLRAGIPSIGQDANLVCSLSSAAECVVVQGRNENC